MDRVRSATTQDELDAIWQEALAAQHSGGLTIAQVDRLDTEIAKRGAALEVEAAK
jgi:hypothetical protein